LFTVGGRIFLEVKVFEEKWVWKAQ
jgi:hypothetical protein